VIVRHCPPAWLLGWLLVLRGHTTCCVSSLGAPTHEPRRQQNPRTGRQNRARSEKPSQRMAPGGLLRNWIPPRRLRLQQRWHEAPEHARRGSQDASARKRKTRSGHGGSSFALGNGSPITGQSRIDPPLVSFEHPSSAASCSAAVSACSPDPLVRTCRHPLPLLHALLQPRLLAPARSSATPAG
jgi:hypothetical protein